MTDMKTKKQLLQKIMDIRKWRDTVIIQETPQSKKKRIIVCNAMILSLQSAIGYKIAIRYWCCRCGFFHINLKCPKCGNNQVISKLEG